VILAVYCYSCAAVFTRLKRSSRIRRFLGYEETLWTRKVADMEVRRLVQHITPPPSSVLEISGFSWQEFGFDSYQSADYPAFDICEQTLPEKFDLIIAEHILEHLLHPQRAIKNIHSMLNPGGHLLTVTPFLYKVHPNPNDLTRWTEQGLKELLLAGGFVSITTGSWGNRSCIKATMRKEYRLFNRYLHSLLNEPDFPVVVWGLAKRD
jgi:SAM-dependent methyltransferase